MKNAWILVLLAVGVILFFFRRKVAQLARHFLTRGSPVIDKADWPYNKTTGVVELSPDDLAFLANTDVDTFALATMLSSEVGDESEDVKIAHGWVAMNYAAETGQSVSKLLTTAKNSKHNGKFGSQADLEKTTSSGVHPSDRYASTRLVPYDDDLGIAVQIRNGTFPDPTGGAIQYDNPAVEDKLFAQGKTTIDGAGLARKREGEGKVAVYVDGLDPDRFRFWRRA